MYQTLLNDTRLYKLLLRLDKELAAQAKAKGCHCGGKLHSACYPRKPRGVPDGLDDAYAKRHSFCCAAEDCRRRTTPPSFRFLGRKVFVSTVIVLVTVLRHGPTPMRLTKLRELVGVSARTVNRWRLWWREVFAQTPFWKAACGFFRTPVDQSSLPLSLLEAFPVNQARRKLLRLLRFICPLTTAQPQQEI